MDAEQPARIAAIAEDTGNGIGRKAPSPISVKHHPSFSVIPAAEMKVPPKLNSSPYPMAATNVPVTAIPTTPDKESEPSTQGDFTRSRSRRRRGSLMAPTQVKATAEHPASIQKHAANPAAFTSPNATRGPRRSEAEVVRRYRPSQRPRAWGGAASETVAVADDQKEARPTACTQRTKSICQNSAHSGNRMPPSTNDARPTSMTGFVPHRSAAGPKAKRKRTAAARYTLF